MPKLTGKQQAFVVACLACFDSPSEVVQQVRETFGVDVDRAQVWTYDASKPANRGRMRRELVELFDLTRAEFLADCGGTAIANKAVRLRELQKLYDSAKQRGAVALGAELLEQAAKEVGGAYTNRREISGPSGGPIETRTAPHDLTKLSDDQLAELERILAAAEPSVG